MTNGASILKALAGETLPTPPVWLMRQAGRYLPEYRATRAQAGSFLDLCYDSALAAEVTMQPIRRFGFDAAIVFADILLLPQALGRKLWFEVAEGPRLEPLATMDAVERLAAVEAMHAHLAPIYETVRLVRSQLAPDVALIGFAGAPWTVATYMIAGRGKDKQAGAKALMRDAPDVFAALMTRLESTTAAYLCAQIEAGAQIVKVFDSWAGALADEPAQFQRWCIDPMARIVESVRARHPAVPVIGFPREAGALCTPYLAQTRVEGIAIDTAVDPEWARDALQGQAAVQGNLDPALMVTGGAALDAAVDRLLDVLGGGPFIFNLGHGITPDADPRNVERLIRRIRK